MIAPTHLVIAQTSYLAGCLLTGHPPSAAEAGAGMIASQLPDLDTQTSYIGRLAPPLADWIEHQVGHRTLTHSALFAALLILAAWLWLPRGYVIAISAGLLSHSFSDMMTKGGICWFWPARVRCVLPGNPKYRMEVASWPELWFLAVMVAIGLVMMPLAETGKGPSGLIRTAIGSLAAARQEFDAGKGDWAYRLDIEGRDNRSFADISGRYRVIGPHGSAGFLLASATGTGSDPASGPATGTSTATGPVTVCGSGGSACDWYAATARLERANPQRTTSHRIDRQQLDAGELAAALTPLQAAGEVYLIGTVSAPGTKPAPPTLTTTGDDQVQLHYATPALIATWAERGRRLRDVRLTIQIRHAPTVKAPALMLSNAAEPPPLAPNRLNRWLPED
jgi:inner membrane protein